MKTGLSLLCNIEKGSELVEYWTSQLKGLGTIILDSFTADFLGLLKIPREPVKKSSFSPIAPGLTSMNDPSIIN